MPAARKCANTVPASRMIGISIKKQINGIVFAADDADRDVGKHHEEYADEGDDDAGEKAAALKERRLATSMGPQTAAGIAASTTRSSGPQLTSLTKSMATSDSGSRAAAAIHIGLYQRARVGVIEWGTVCSEIGRIRDRSVKSDVKWYSHRLAKPDGVPLRCHLPSALAQRKNLLLADRQRCLVPRFAGDPGKIH